MNRIKELEELLREASLLYYGGDESSLSDQEFDKFRDELEELDPDNAFLQEVGAPSASALSKVKHNIPMGSLKKITTCSEFGTWAATISKKSSSLECVVELKLDGLSIELVYENGKFTQAITRGNGKIGEDVTHTIRNAKGYPKAIAQKGRVSVRCEAMLSIKAWKTHYAEKANPRNTASGLVRRTDAKGSKHLTCIAFDVLFDDSNFSTEKDRIDWLEDNDFKHTTCDVVAVSDVETAVKAIEARRDKLPFEVDGAVVKLNDIAEQEKLGEHDGRPYWARAWKFAAMGGHSILEAVEWSVGTQGTITPVANIAPVTVGGTVIRNVTLHNMDEIDRLGIRIGDAIEVIRAGDVIPKIIKVVKKGTSRRKISISRCPACKSQVERDGPRMVCSNAEDCVGVNSSRISKWIKKREIMYFGDSNLQLVLASGHVTSIVD